MTATTDLGFVHGFTKFFNSECTGWMFALFTCVVCVMIIIGAGAWILNRFESK